MQITEFKLINKDSLKASFNVLIPTWDITIRGMKYFEKAESSWFAYPSQSYKDNDGKTKYYQYILFGERSKPKFELSLREELKKHLNVPKEEPEYGYSEEQLPF